VDAPGLIKFCEKDVSKMQTEKVAKSHKSVEQKVKLSNQTYFNTDGTNMESVGKLHELSLIADPAMYAANMKRIEAREQRLARKQAGKSTLEDLRAEYNAPRD